MKVKFLAIFLIGLLLGALFGNILFGQVIAQYYHSPGTELYYLKKILNSVENIEDDVSWIKFDM
ncbi:hypothetical protein ES705_07501 [subsurface metagenome]|nr:hypothetical protein [Clostridia bacterium]